MPQKQDVGTKAETEFVPYNVKVTASALNYRSGPGTSYKVKGTVKRNEIYGMDSS